MHSQKFLKFCAGADYTLSSILFQFEMEANKCNDNSKKKLFKDISDFKPCSLKFAIFEIYDNFSDNLKARICSTNFNNFHCIEHIHCFQSSQNIFQTLLRFTSRMFYCLFANATRSSSVLLFTSGPLGISSAPCSKSSCTCGLMSALMYSTIRLGSVGKYCWLFVTNRFRP